MLQISKDMIFERQRAFLRLTRCPLRSSNITCVQLSVWRNRDN